MRACQVLPTMAPVAITQFTLDLLNVEQAKNDNRATLDALGGINKLAELIGVNIETGLNEAQILSLREKFGTNAFPESPLESYFALLFAALTDSTLMILSAAATVSLIIGVLTEENGWIEGTAVFIAIFLVSNISAGNDYSKQLQFRALEASTSKDERCSVLREGVVCRINPVDLVVGDILVLQAGDMIPADSIIVTEGFIKTNESSLTGEPDDLRKTAEKDCFLLSSCLVTEGEECHALVIGIGLHSQWGKIKANLVTEAVNTPLQDKLEHMTTQIGYIGMVSAFGTFVALVIGIWVPNGGKDVLKGFVDAFIIGVTVVVVAIPEGLPLAVTISLAYSTKKMYEDQCLIRVLAACETMGNATNICSDKTGTLTENRMTVVEGWFANEEYNQDDFAKANLSDAVKQILVEQISINRSAYLVFKDSDGKVLDRPTIIGNKTEGALIMMIRSWGFDCEDFKHKNFNEKQDKIYSFNSTKKRSTAVVHRPDGSVRVYCKGASEWILRDCSLHLNESGKVVRLSDSKKAELENSILGMAEKALRTLCLAHKDYARASELPPDWQDNPPDNTDLCLDCIVGIIDPLRSDVKEAVRIAQAAGVTVRMVTGDNIATASAIARQCGILTLNGLAVEGPTFRKMSPADVDGILPRLQVVARSSPDDKYLLVTRLNGHGIPNGQEAWEKKFAGFDPPVAWETHKDLLLPGYTEEWEANRPDGGDVVGVTGDGTNDAPALKAADVGLAMGITGTKVAQGAADIVILDDKFSSIVRAISWGRCVYDNIRKFLQFQLTVNVVALALVFIGAVAGFGEPLNAVQLLWVNLIMDTMGALALGTEGPIPALLQRKPYKRSASLISRPMWRSIICQSLYQLIVLLILLFKGAEWFNVREGEPCARYQVSSDSESRMWYVNETSHHFVRVDRDNIYNPYDQLASSNYLQCSDYKADCGSNGIDCLEEKRTFTFANFNETGSDVSLKTSYHDVPGFESKCLTCNKVSYVHGSLIFNTFIFCQVFNEYTGRKIFNELNMFDGAFKNFAFIGVSTFTIGAQIFLIEIGGDFVRTSPLNWYEWLITVAIGAGSLIVGVLMRFIPVVEDPNSFFDNSHNLLLGTTAPRPTQLELSFGYKDEDDVNPL